MLKKVYGTLHGKTSRNMKHVRRDSDEKVTTVLSTEVLKVESVMRHGSAVDSCTVKVGAGSLSRPNASHFVDFKGDKLDKRVYARLSTSFLLDVLDMDHTINQMLQCEQWRKAVIAKIWMTNAHADP